MAAAFIVALVLVAIAELGDKTQLLTLVLAARHGARPVFIGVALAILALQLLAVTVGGLVNALVPPAVLAWVTGGLFIGFGAWNLITSGREEAEDTEEAPRGIKHPVAGTAAAFFVAELGDKTQIMTMAIAADPGAAARSLGTFASGLSFSGVNGISTLAAVWLGSTIGMLVVNGAAALVGTAVGERLPARTLGRISGVVFIAFGVLTVASYLLGG